jgi:hypothetical protein
MTSGPDSENDRDSEEYAKSRTGSHGGPLQFLRSEKGEHVVATLLNLPWIVIGVAAAVGWLVWLLH